MAWQSPSIDPNVCEIFIRMQSHDEKYMVLNPHGNGEEGEVTLHSSSGEEQHEDNRLDLELCLTLLDLPESTLDAYFNMAPLVLDGVEVPAAYVRTRIIELQLDPAADFDLILEVRDPSTQEVRDYKLHRVVWDSQCAQRLSIDETGSIDKASITLSSFEAIETFLEWLYTNDEDRLYESLVAGNEQSMTFTTNFCKLVRMFGCVDARFTSIIEAVYED